MISVIVPTMWRHLPFVDFIEYVAKVPQVGEIIIINNDISLTPVQVNNFRSNEKFVILDQQTNINVNASWNLGAQISKYNKLCFLNDDATVDLKLFSVMDDFLTDQVGACGIVEYLQGSNQPPFKDGSIDLVQRTDQSCYGFGVLFFIHKNNWIPIPNELVWGFGDNWVFDTQVFIKKKSNYLIANTHFYHAVSKTTNSVHISKEVKEDIYKKEHSLYFQLFDQLRSFG